MASYDKIAAIDRELTQMRQKKIDLFKRREILMLDEAVRLTTADQPSAADQIAAALISVYNEHHAVSLETLFGVQSAEVNTAGLLQMAEWRCPKTIEIFLKYGADVNGCDKEGFSVLEMVIQGHDGYWRGESNHWNEAVFDVLAKYNVRREISNGWIIDQCCDGAPKYVRDFLELDV
jgi:hypothetical protein